MKNKAQGHPDRAGKQRRGPDRRACKLMRPPPYQTREGIVTVDRRSQIDRRANWIREYALNGGQ